MYVIFDMYGVILKESKGNFIPFTLRHFPETDRNFFIEQFNRAQVGRISSREFLQSLGFEDWENKQAEYLTNCLTFDEGFRVLTKRLHGSY